MQYNVSGIGNPLLDLTLKIEEDFLIDTGFKKGGMHLIDEMEAEKIMKKIKAHDIRISPGGSVANVLAGVSGLGGSTVLLGKVGQDDYGAKYLTETKNAGTESMLIHDKDRRTGHAITFITPDGERTFAVHLGAALHFGKKDVHTKSIKNSQILHMEGFKIEDCRENDTLQYAIKVAKESQTKISVDLSDGELVKRNFDYLKKFIHDHVDIVFANEIEAEAFTGKKEKDALHEISKLCETAVVKLGEKGSLIQSNGHLHEIEPNKIIVENTNGAGDMYAAGILYGLTNGMPMDRAGKMASHLASLVVASEEARLNKDLRKLSLDDKIK